MSLLVLLLSLLGLQGAAPAQSPADGSLIVRFDPAKVSPSSVRINGPLSSTRDRNASVTVTFGSIPPGQYDVEPVYDGGVSGAHRTVTVEPGKPATLTITAESVGAVQLGAAQETCDAAVEFGVARPGPIPSAGSSMVVNLGAPAGRAGGFGAAAPGIQMPASRGTMGFDNAVVARFPKMPRGCFRVVAGLPPGSYQAFYSGPDGPISVRTFEVLEQQTISVAVGPPPAHLSGRVLYNGQPPAGAVLRFRPRTNTLGSPAVATIGADGRYAVSFAQVGTYSVIFSLGGPTSFGPGLMSSVTVVDGPNTFDWSVTGGTLVISVKNWDRRSPLALIIQSRTATSSGSSMTTHDAQTPYPIRLEGQTLGNYTIAAYQRDNGPASRATMAVTLDQMHPEAFVELELAPNPGVITLRDESGAPVVGAMVTGAMAGRAVEETPGVFPLRGLPFGVELHIEAPGFVPACGAAKPEAQSLTMRRGRSMEVVFTQMMPSVFNNIPSGAVLVESGGSLCSIPLSWLKYTKVPTAPNEPTRFLFDNFPQGDRFTWLPVAGSADKREIVVPASGPIIIR